MKGHLQVVAKLAGETKPVAADYALQKQSKTSARQIERSFLFLRHTNSKNVIVVAVVFWPIFIA